MEGANLASKRQLDMLLFGAWHSAMFERQEKLRKLSYYLGSSEPSAGSKAAQAIAWAHRMQARGIDITISKNEIN